MYVNEGNLDFHYGSKLVLSSTMSNPVPVPVTPSL